MTACSTGGELLVHDAVTAELISHRKLFDESANLGALAILPGSAATIVPHIVNRTFPVNMENIKKR